MFSFTQDPGPGAAIGGMIGTCCSGGVLSFDSIQCPCHVMALSGTNAVKYGVMKDWVLSITVVLANGEIVKLGM